MSDDIPKRKQLCFKITADHQRMLKIVAANLEMTQSHALEILIQDAYFEQQRDPTLNPDAAD